MSEQQIVVDFSKKKQLNESWLRMFGSSVESILKAMFGGYSVPTTIRGSKSDITSFAKTIGREKDFLTAANEYGLTNPLTYRNKFKLERAIIDFERSTGVPWPLK